MITRVRNLQLATTFDANFEQDINTTTGLSFGHVGGSVHNFGVLQTIAAGTVTVPNGVSTIFLDVDPAVATIEAAADPDVGSDRWIPLYLINTNNGAITTVTDLRSFTSASLGDSLGTPP